MYNLARNILFGHKCVDEDVSHAVDLLNRGIDEDDNVPAIVTLADLLVTERNGLGRDMQRICCG